MIVRFNDVDEFVDELEKEAGEPSRDKLWTPGPRIVRVTPTVRPLYNGAISSLTVIATFVNRRGEIVKLETWVGELWRGPRDDEVRAAATAIIKDIEARAQDAGYECRAGVYEETE